MPQLFWGASVLEEKRLGCLVLPFFLVLCLFFFLLPILVTCAHEKRNIHVVNKIVC